MEKYDMEAAAEGVMLTIDELKEIYDIYFEDAVEQMQAAYVAVEQQDYIALGKVMHALKGSSSNLRMDTIAVLTSRMEEFAKTGRGAEVASYLPGIAEEIEGIKKQVYAFYEDSEK